MVNVRRYQAGEEEEIWSLYYHTTRLINGQDYTADQVRRWAPDEKPPDWNERLKEKNPFVAEVNGQIVGFAELDPDGHIDKFYCHHLWQRQGVGKLLLAAIEREAVQRKIGLLFSDISVTAHDFFLSRGFKIVGERDNWVCGAVAKNFQMEKRLNSYEQLQ